MNNVIVANLAKGRKVITAPVFQWNHGMVLRFINAQLPDNFRVDFSNSTRGVAKSQMGTPENGVVIPDEYFMPGGAIYAWIVESPTEHSAVARWEITIPLDPKSKWVDVQPTPQEENIIDEAIHALNESVADAQEAISHYPKVVDGYWYVWDVTAGEYVSTGVQAQGPAGQDGTDGQDGDDGTTFTPSVSADGVISWTNDGGRENPESVDLAGIASDKAIEAEQDVIDALHNLIDYDYDTPFDQEENPTASGYRYRVGVVRRGNILTLNKSTTPSTTIRMRISGGVDFAGNFDGVAAWDDGLTLKDEHQYKITVSLLSGTSNYDANTPNVVPYCYVYETGESTDVTTHVRRRDGISVTKFNAHAGKTYILALILNSGKFLFDNAKLLVVLEDLDEAGYTELTDSIAIQNIGDSVRDTADLTGSATTGGYIELNKSIGTTIPDRVEPDTDYGHLETTCHAGDTFWLTCTGGDEPRAWAFLDSNRVLLRVANANVTADALALMAYEDGYFVCNYAVASTFALSAKKLFKAANAASIPPAPTAAGTYVLTVTVADGVPTYAWTAQS